MRHRSRQRGKMPGELTHIRNVKPNLSAEVCQQSEFSWFSRKWRNLMYAYPRLERAKKAVLSLSHLLFPLNFITVMILNWPRNTFLRLLWYLERFPPLRLPYWALLEPMASRSDDDVIASPACNKIPAFQSDDIEQIRRCLFVDRHLSIFNKLPA